MAHTRGKTKKREGKVRFRNAKSLATGNFGWSSGGRMHCVRKRLLATNINEDQL